MMPAIFGIVSRIIEDSFITLFVGVSRSGGITNYELGIGNSRRGGEDGDGVMADSFFAPLPLRGDKFFGGIAGGRKKGEMKGRQGSAGAARCWMKGWRSG